ncbi:MAG: tetratricopeptide repeat protein [Acetobacteraceae bacterium]|nr:tetratricopeptide repeat protein [Acetobacteraceae bacterium]
MAQKLPAPTEQPDAFDYILRGRAAVSNPRSRSSYAEGVRLFEYALALDPQSVAAQSWLAVTLAGRVINHMTDTAEADIARAEGLITQALAASPRSVTVHFARGEVLRAQRRYDEAIPEYETVLAFDRNSVSGLVALGHCKLMTGSVEDVIPLMERAIRLSPRDPQIAVKNYRIGEVHLLQSRIDEAIASLETARSANLELAYVRAFLAAAYALKGEIERAAAELSQARRLSRGYLSIAQQKAGFFWVPKTRVMFEATYFAGLRKAGLPEVSAALFRDPQPIKCSASLLRRPFPYWAPARALGAALPCGCGLPGNRRQLGCEPWFLRLPVRLIERSGPFWQSCSVSVLGKSSSVGAA